MTLLSSTLTSTETAARYRQIESGNCKLLYIAPERCDSPRFQRFIETANVSLLVIDDFAISPMGARERTDLLELLDDRVGTRATLITSQLPIENWHDYIGDPTLADAIMDRLVHSAHKIHLEGETMRKRAAAERQKAGSKPKKFD